MTGNRVNKNPDTPQVDAQQGYTPVFTQEVGKPTQADILAQKETIRKELRPKVSPDQGDMEAAARAAERKADLVGTQGQVSGKTPPPPTATVPTGGFDKSTGGIPRASMVPGAAPGGGRARNDARVTTTYREGAEEFRKRQARSLELAALENVRAAEATEDYYENVAIARRDAAAVYKGEADGMRRLKETALKESLEQAQKVQDIARKVGAFSPRPGRLFADASGAASFGAAMALAAGAMESARSGGPNVALKIIDNAIKRDIAAQELEFKAMRAEMEGEATVLQEMRGTYRDAIVAQKAQMAAEQEAALMYLQAQMDQYMAPVKKAQMMALAHQLQAQKNNTLITMSERTYQIVTEHKRTQVMADLKKLNAQGPWNDRDLSYDELQESLDLAAAGEEGEAASAEEQGAAFAEERLRKAQQQAEEAERIDPAPPPQARPREPGPRRGEPREAPPQEAPPQEAPPTVAAPEEGPTTALDAESTVAEEEARAYELERRLQQAADLVDVVDPKTGKVVGRRWQAKAGQDQELVDLMVAGLQETRRPEMREGRNVPESVKRGGDINIQQQTRGREDPKVSQWKREIADNPEVAREVKEDLETFLGGWLTGSATKSDQVEAGRLAQIASEVGSYEGVPKGSRQSKAVNWVYRVGEPGAKTGYREKAKAGLAGARGLPIVALAPDDSEASLKRFQQYVAGEGAPPNTKFQRVPVPQDFNIKIPLTQSDGSTKMVSVPFRGSVPGYMNRGLAEPTDSAMAVVRGVQNQGSVAGRNPYNPKQKLFFKKNFAPDATPEQRARMETLTRDTLDRANKLLSATYAIELYDKLYNTGYGFAGLSEYLFKGGEVSKADVRKALKGVPPALRQSAMAQLGLPKDADKGEGDVAVTLSAIKTLAGTVSHQEGFKTPQRVELGLSQEALGATTIDSIFEFRKWLQNKSGLRSQAAGAYRARLEQTIDAILDDTQPEVDLKDAIREAQKESIRNLPKSTGRGDG